MERNVVRNSYRMPRHPVKDYWRQPEFQEKTGSTLLRLANLAEPKRDNALVRAYE